jgi:AAA15 family ATPase/GTPase
VANEWLYKNRSPLFERTGESVIRNNLANKDKIPATIPYKHSLFLTYAAAFDSEGDCNKVWKNIGGYIISNLSLAQNDLRSFSMFYLDNKKNKQEQFLHILSAFNLKYDDIMLLKDSETGKTNVFPQEKIFLIKHYDKENPSAQTFLNLKYQESSGTQKLFDLAGLLLIAFDSPLPFLIVLDEIDDSFHPALLIKLIELFNDPNVNKAHSQLLFTSHDTNLLSPSIMRRDQFYFTEKREDESTRLYSLADLKGIRNDADFARQYLAGFYGALPVLEDYRQKEEE